MADVQQVHARIKKMIEMSARCAQAETSDNYGLLADEIEEIEVEARKEFEAKLNLDVLLKKLKNRKPLTPDDMKMLELLIVGEAEYYLKYETELDHWRNEVKQLIGEMSKFQSPELDAEGLMHLRALCREAARVLPAIVFYFDQKERTAKFQDATKGQLDAEGYTVLAEIVQETLASGKM